MQPTHHPLCNDTLRRPKGTTEEECSDLPILRDEDSVCSFWQPNEAEVFAILAGKAVLFRSHSITHPPIEIGVLDSEPEKDNEPSAMIKEIADSYLRSCYPNGCPAHQAIDIRLALYGGMMAFFKILTQTQEKYANDEDANVEALSEIYEALTSRAINLNKERSSL